MIAFVEILNDQGRRYGSYTDYWRLVELSGFPIVEQDAIDYGSDNTYILSPPNGNTHAMAKAPRKCKLVCWNLERPAGGFGGFAPDGYDAVWVSDGWIARNLRSDPRVRLVPVGGHPQLAGNPSEHKKWDFTHQAYIYGRRAAIVNGLIAAGHCVGGACWGSERDRQLSESRRGLCLHQDQLQAIEPLRYTLFSCWKLPLVTEPVHCPWPYLTFGLEEMDRADDGETNYWMMAETMTFRRCVERAA